MTPWNHKETRDSARRRTDREQGRGVYWRSMRGAGMACKVLFLLESKHCVIKENADGFRKEGDGQRQPTIPTVPQTELHTSTHSHIHTHTPTHTFTHSQTHTYTHPDSCASCCDVHCEITERLRLEFWAEYNVHKLPETDKSTGIQHSSSSNRYYYYKLYYFSNMNKMAMAMFTIIYL